MPRRKSPSSKVRRPKVVKVSDETHAKLAGMARWDETMDDVIGRLTTQTRGLEEVIAGQSSICFIDGHRGRLLYRGYDIEDLAAKSSYEETTYLLWNGRLPTAGELRSFTSELASKRAVPKELASILTTLPKNCDAMDALQVGLAALGVFDDPIYQRQEKAVSIASKIGTIVAAIHRHKHDQELLAPKPDLGYASNFLYLVTGKEPSAEDATLMDALLILHADHELNASTFTARIMASTLSDIYSAMTGAVGALKGSLHGGANEKVVEMTEEIGDPARAEAYVHSKFAEKQKLPGFGHRVYKTIDPRAKILKEMDRGILQSAKEKESLEILEKVEEMMREEKSLYPNVDLYSGLAFRHIGISNYLFTPVFAVGRAPGWLAHVLEQFSDNRIIRPRAEYTGPARREYAPIETRTMTAVAKQ